MTLSQILLNFDPPWPQARCEAREEAVNILARLLLENAPLPRLARALDEHAEQALDNNHDK